MRGEALELLGRRDAAVDDYADYSRLLRSRGARPQRHPLLRTAEKRWGALLTAGAKSLRRQHNPKGQKFDWTGRRPASFNSLTAVSHYTAKSFRLFAF